MSVYQSEPDPDSAAPVVAPVAAPSPAATAAAAAAAGATLPMHTPIGTCCSWWILGVPLCQKLRVCQKPMELLVAVWYVLVLLEGRVEVLVGMGSDYDLSVVRNIVRAESLSHQ